MAAGVSGDVRSAAVAPRWRLPDGCDRRLTPAREDLADAALEGRVPAERYVRPRAGRITGPLVDLRPSPGPMARIDTQLPFGEPIEIYDDADGWIWLRSRIDGYVGYALAESAASAGHEPTHRVATRAALVFEAPDIKAAAVRLPWASAVCVAETVAGAGTNGLLGRLASGGYVPMAQLRPLTDRATDWVAEAEALIGQPYLWGGRSGDGVDCSSLIQLALAAAGCAFPRDSDMQAAAELPGTSRLDRAERDVLRRGDLVFWAGHVGVMQDERRLLHANAHHMAVASEPLSDTTARIAAKEGKDITSILRLDTDAMLDVLPLDPPLAVPGKAEQSS
ncbi:MAG: NlpC/P60 family protein [Pseudomonadota bacterium]